MARTRKRYPCHNPRYIYMGGRGVLMFQSEVPLPPYSPVYDERLDGIFRGRDGG